MHFASTILTSVLVICKYFLLNLHMKKLKRRSHCPIGYGLDVFGDRWTLLILRDMIFMKKCRYGDFLESGEGISTNILADRLAFLESQKLITKQVDKENKSKFIYAVTEKGLDLFPVMMEIILWSFKYDKDTAVTAEYAARIRADKEAYIREMMESFRDNP